MSAPHRIRVVTIGGVTYRKLPDGQLSPLSTAGLSPSSLDQASRSVADWTRGELAEPGKTPVTIRLDRDLVEWFKLKGPRYQTRMN